MLGNSSDSQEVSDEVAKTLAPVVALISLYSLIGIVGNPFVVIFYGCKQQQTPSFIFILCLAVFDLIVCCVSVPMEIVDLVEYYTFPNPGACKVLKFVNFFAAITSGLFLLPIATDRYRKICTPHKNQISNHLAKILVAVTIFVGLFLSWPCLILYTNVSVNVTIGNGIVGYDCTSMKDDPYQWYATIYHTLLFFFIIVSTTSVIVIYILVMRQLFKTQHSFRSYRGKNKNAEQKSKSHTSLENSDNIKNKETCTPFYCLSAKESITFKSGKSAEQQNKAEKRVDTKENTQFSDSTIPHEILSTDIGISNKSTDMDLHEDVFKCNHIQGHTKSYNINKKEAFNLHTRKYTFISFAITTAFILSYLPYLIIFLWLNMAEINLVSDVSSAEFVLIEIGFHSWIINSVVNPFIYGFFNTQFRHFVAEVIRAAFCCHFCRKSSA